MTTRCPSLPEEHLRARRQAKRAELDRASALTPKAGSPPQAVFDMHRKVRAARLKADSLRIANPNPSRKIQKAIKEHEDEARRCELRAQELMDESSASTWVQAANDETVALAEARGEVVERGKRGIRIMTRGGLDQAYDAGYMAPNGDSHLTPADLRRTAETYRDCYEKTSGMTTPSQSGSGGQAMPWAVSLAQAGEDLATMRRGLTKLEIEVLDRVCGQDMRARETATVLHRSFLKVREALAGALTSATVSTRAARAARDTGDHLTADRLRAADAQINAALRSC